MSTTTAPEFQIKVNRTTVHIDGLKIRTRAGDASLSYAANACSALARIANRYETKAGHDDIRAALADAELTATAGPVNRKVCQKCRDAAEAMIAAIEQDTDAEQSQAVEQDNQQDDQQDTVTDTAIGSPDDVAKRGVAAVLADLGATMYPVDQDTDTNTGNDLDAAPVENVATVIAMPAPKATTKPAPKALAELLVLDPAPKPAKIKKTTPAKIVGQPQGDPALTNRQHQTLVLVINNHNGLVTTRTTREQPGINPKVLRVLTRKGYLESAGVDDKGAPTLNITEQTRVYLNMPSAGRASK